MRLLVSALAFGVLGLLFWRTKESERLYLAKSEEARQRRQASRTATNNRDRSNWRLRGFEG